MLALLWHDQVCQYPSSILEPQTERTFCRPLAQAPRTVALMMQGKKPVPELQAEQALVAGADQALVARAEQALTDASARAPAASQLVDGMKQSLPRFGAPQDAGKQV